MEQQQRITLRNCMAAMLAAVTAGFTPPAHAQDAAEIAPAIEQVTVTARRREESQQSVPLSVSALGPKALERVEINDMADLQRLVPSLNLTAASPSRNLLAFSLRGQRTQEFQLLSDPPVGTYFAEVVQPRPTGFGEALFDLQSVQVLKGVQGTLFGRNMTGGAVLVEPQHPTDQFEGEVSLTAGNYETREAYAMVNVPFGDKLSLRLAGKRREREGFSKNLTTGQDHDDGDVDAWRASLLFRPTDAFESLFVYDGLQHRRNGIGVFFGHPATPNPACFGPPVVCRPIDYYSPPLNSLFGFENAQAIAAQQAARNRGREFENGSPEQIATFGRPFDNVDNWGITNKTQYIFGDYTLKNIAAYRHMKWNQLTDMDGSILDWIYAQQIQDIKMVSEELQLQGKSFDGRLEWIVGAYYFREYGEDGALSANFNELARLSPGAGSLTAQQLTFSNVGSAATKTWAGFAAGTLSLTDQWKLSAGVRYTDDKRKASIEPARPNIGACVWVPITSLSECRFHNEAGWSEISWDTTLQYQATSDLMAYGSVRRGFRAGGFSLRATSDAAFLPFHPEFVTEYELGAKSDWNFGTSSALRANVALFYQDYTDVQRQFRTTAAGTVVTLVVNTPEQEIYGAELELTYQPFDGLEISAGYSRIKSHVLDSGDVTVRYALVGAAEDQVSLGAFYRLPLDPAFGEISIGAGWFWKGDAHLVDTDPEGNEPSYDLLSLKLTWEEIFGSGFSISAFANNLTDTFYRTGVMSLQSGGVGYTSDFFGDPRIWGVEVRYEFGELAH